MLGRRISHSENKGTRLAGEPTCPQQGLKVAVVLSAVTQAETACLMTVEAVYRLQAPLEKPPSHVRLQPQIFAHCLGQQESGSALQAY